MPKLNETQKTLVILGVGVLGAIGGGVLSYNEHGKLEVLQQEIETLSKQQSDNQTEINKVPGLEENVVAYKQIVEQTSDILPTEEGLHQFIRDLATKEADNDVTIVSLPRFDTGRPTRAITPIPMRMTVRGTSRAFLRFLNAVEMDKRLVNVSEVRAAPGGDNPETPGDDLVHEWSLRMMVYRYDAEIGAGAQDLIPRNRELVLRDPTSERGKRVQAIIAENGEPKKLEKYKLLLGRETRRDFFLDPRRRIAGDTSNIAGQDDSYENERTEVQALELLLEKARLELDAYKSAKSARDYLLMAAAKRNFLRARLELETNMERVARRSPPFQHRDNADRYNDNVKTPYGNLIEEAGREMKGIDESARLRVTEEDAKQYRTQLEALMAERQFEAAVEKGANVEQLVADADKNVEPGAREHVQAIGAMRVQAQAHVALEKKQMDVQGVVRMEHTSAVIINGNTLLPGKRFDNETEFVRVERIVEEEDGRRVEKGDRLIFRIQGIEVDYLPKRPDLLEQNQPLLGLE